MTLTLALALVLTAAPDASRPAKFASPGLAVVNIEPKLADFYTEHLAQQVKLLGVEIVTVREITALLGFERQKQLLCGEESSSCITELASALGADGVLLGDLAKLGNRFTVNLKVIGAESGRTLAVFSGSAASEDELLDVLTQGARKLAVEGSTALGRAPPKLEVARPPLRKLAIAPAAVGVAALVAGAVCLVWSESDYQALSTGAPGVSGNEVRTRGQLTGTLGVAGLAIGGAAVAGAVVMFVLGAEPPVMVTAGPSGASVSFRGAFP